MYAGRLTVNKGVSIACQAATHAGVKLKLIGHGDRSLITGGHEYLGAVDNKTRNELMAKAKAVFTPTMYVEPFGCTAIEAQMSGTPVISTNFGAFVETVEHGKTGYRCNYMGEFIDAIHQAPRLDRQYIRARAILKYSLHSVKHDYQKYFDRLSLLWDDGWNTVSTKEVDVRRPVLC